MNRTFVTDLTQIPEDRLTSYECSLLAKGITRTEVTYPETSLTSAELSSDDPEGPSYSY